MTNATNRKPVSATMLRALRETERFVGGMVVGFSRMEDRYLVPLEGVRITTITALQERGLLDFDVMTRDPLFGTVRTFRARLTEAGYALLQDKAEGREAKLDEILDALDAAYAAHNAALDIIRVTKAAGGGDLARAEADATLQAATARRLEAQAVELGYAG